MAVRSSMADLIALVQLLIADPTAAQFSAQQVQDALDRRRRVLRYEPLRAEPTYSNGGALAYLDYYSRWGTWEADVAIQGGTYTTLTPSASELLAQDAHWAFAANTYPPVYATGKVYDVYAAAADLLDAWAAAKALDFQFLANGSRFFREQVFDMLSKRAAEYRKRAWVGTAALIRDDGNPAHEVSTGTAGDPVQRGDVGPVSEGVPNIRGVP